MLTFILALTTFLGYERILEVGCGDGAFAAQLAHEVPDGFVLGIDADAEKVAFAERTYDPDLFANLQFEACAPSELTEIAEFEVIVVHGTPAVAAAGPLVAALRPGGKLVITKPAQPTCVYEALDVVASSEAWHEWLSDYQRLPPCDIQRMATLGLLSVRMDVQEAKRFFPDRHAVGVWLMEWLPVSVPHYRRAALVDAVIDQVLEAHPDFQDSNGFVIPHSTTTAEFKKVAA